MPITLNDREFELVNLIGRDPEVNQRNIARRLNLSLGMVNRLIRRLVKNEWLYMEQIDRRKVRYRLTAAGRAQQHQKSIQHTWNHIRSLGQLKQRIRDIMLNLYRQGYTCLYIWGEDDGVALADLARRELDLKDFQLQRLDMLPLVQLDGPVLLCMEGPPPEPMLANRYINLIEQANVPLEAGAAINTREVKSPSTNMLSGV